LRESRDVSKFTATPVTGEASDARAGARSRSAIAGATPSAGAVGSIPTKQLERRARIALDDDNRLSDLGARREVRDAFRLALACWCRPLAEIEHT